jgi:hypothetical protein
MLRIPHCLQSRLRDGGQVFSRLHFSPESTFWYSCLLQAHMPKGHSAAGRIGPIEKLSDLTGTRVRNPPACTAQSQPSALRDRGTALLSGTAHRPDNGDERVAGSSPMESTRQRGQGSSRTAPPRRSVSLCIDREERACLLVQTAPAAVAQSV